MDPQDSQDKGGNTEKPPTVQNTSSKHKKKLDSKGDSDSDTSDESLASEEDYKPGKELANVYVESTEVNKNSKCKDRKVYIKKHYCPFCPKRQENIIRHIERCHSKEPEVQAMKEAPRGPTRNKLTTMMTNRGDFLHNIKVLSEERGNLVVVRRPLEVGDPSRYYPCGTCWGFHSKFDLWRHKCVGDRTAENEGSALRHSKMILLSALYKLNPKLADVLAQMRKDAVTDTVRSDRLILKLMSLELDKHDHKKPHLVRGRARDLGRLLNKIREMNENLKDCHMEDLLVPEKFDIVREAVKALPLEGGKNTASLPIRLGQSIQKLIGVLSGEAIRKGDNEMLEQARNFTLLYDSEWGDTVSIKARKVLYDRRLNKGIEIARTEDVTKLASELGKEAEERMKEFQDNPNRTTGRPLSEVLLAQIIVLNKRRGGEAARLEISSYDAAKEREANTDYSSELWCGLDEDQKLLAKGLFLVWTIGKTGTHVPIMLTLKMKMKLDLLLENREKIGYGDNPYVFGIPGKQGHLRSWDILRKYCKKINIRGITSTALRRYLATSAQEYIK